MSEDVEVLHDVEFEGIDECIAAITECADAVPGDEIAAIQSSEGFAIMGWAALILFDGIYAVDLLDKDPSR